MSDKVRIAFIYDASNPFYTGRHFDNTTYEFLIKAMQRNKRIDYLIVPISQEYDAGGHLKGKCDAVILSGFRSHNMPKIRGLRTLDVPVISRVGDFHDVSRYGTGERNYDEYGVDCAFNFMSKKYFYRYYPSHMNYQTVFFGIEPSLYQNLVPFKNRIKDKILNSGAVQSSPAKWRVMGSTCLRYARDVLGNPEGLQLKSRLLHPNRSFYHHYKLRTDCNSLEYVTYGNNIAHSIPPGDQINKGEEDMQVVYGNNNEPSATYPSYQHMLSRYAAAIAATTYYPTIKYWEIAAANCLTFMEITERNYGEYLGFRDGTSCISINADNYKERFEEYLADPSDPKWAQIAEAGSHHAMQKFSNDKGAEDLLALIRELS